MISPSLTAIGTELRHAAARRAYAEVERLVVRAGAAAAAEARALPAGDPGIRDIASWLNELFESTGIMLRIARTSQADEFRRMLFLKRYLSRQYRQAPRVHLEF
jgi:hypothetical protein